MFALFIGLVAEWLGSGLQNRVQRFESARDLNIKTLYLMQVGVFHFKFPDIFPTILKKGSRRANQYASKFSLLFGSVHIFDTQKLGFWAVKSETYH